MTHMRTALATAALLLSAVGVGHAQTWRSGTATRQVRGEQQLAVDVEFAAGTLRVHPGPPSELYRSRVRYDADLYESATDFDQRASTLAIRLTPEKDHDNSSAGDHTDQWLDLALSPAVPADLDLQFGAAAAELDLGGLAVRSAKLQTGASKSVVTFEVPNRIACSSFEVEVGAAEFRVVGLGNARCARIDVTGGVGEVELDFTGSWPEAAVTNGKVTIGLGTLLLRLPEGLGVSINVDRFLASFEDSGFEKRGSRYVSAGYDGAAARLDLDLKAVFGDVNVEWVPAGR
jgi:hypothetical protein